MHRKKTDTDAEVVVAVVSNPRDEFLLVHRSSSEGTLSWTFPAGKIHTGETVNEAAVREVFEETGIVCAAREMMGRRVHPDTGRMVSYVLCKYGSGEAKVTEPHILDRVGWMTPKKVLSLITSDVYRPVKELLTAISQSTPPLRTGRHGF